MFKKIFIFCLIIFSGLLFANSAQAGSVGISTACVKAKTAFKAGVGDIYQTPYKGNLANFSCYDETNVSQFPAGNVYSKTAGLLTINGAYAFGANHVELHFCRISLSNAVQITADGRQGTIVINTTDGVYNGGTACNPTDNYFYHNGILQASGHDGWVDINSYNYKLNTTGQIITSGTTGYNSLDGRNTENNGVGGLGSKCSSGSSGKNGGSGAKTCYGGGGGGGGGGGTIKINSPLILTDVSNIFSANGGAGASGAYEGNWYGGGGGSGGIITINNQSSLILNNNLFSNGGNGWTQWSYYPGTGGSGGIIKINSQSSLSINGTLSANGGNSANDGKIEIRTDSGCSKATITNTGKLHAYLGGSGGMINFMGGSFEAVAGSQIKSSGSITVIYRNTCAGLDTDSTKDPNTCTPSGCSCLGTGVVLLPAKPIVVSEPTICAGGGGNAAPYEPINPIPTMGDDGQSLCLSLSWQSGDPEGDPLDFEIYFGDNFALVDGLDPSALITTLYNQASAPGGAYYTYSYDLKNAVPAVCDLKKGAIYYWKIKVKDNK
ncbi:hypothetical protein KKE25_01855 [Patescibacteria group bacterium]|nr:hypothetical protein [Patescibacteria group bacterium]